jgi:hypothetical protein
MGFLIAAAAGAATPYFLDRNGVLWKASADLNGLQLIGESEGAVVARATVPFPFGAPGTSDTEIQVAADEQTGKVAVVWQRNWASDVSDVMLAVWQNGQWEKVRRLSEDSSLHPRFPIVRISQVSTTVPDAAHPDDPARAVVVKDSFLEVVWWEGVADDQHGTMTIWQLNADSPDHTLAFQGSLDHFVFSGVSCDVAVPPAVLEHPQFTAQSAASKSLLFFGVQHTGLFYLLQIGFTLDTQPPAAGGTGMTVIAQRGRHIPIFGLKKVFPMMQDFSMDNARVVLSSDLNPIAYRVNNSTVEYMTYGDQGWSPLRTLAVANGLTLDQAIPLVENLAR